MSFDAIVGTRVFTAYPGIAGASVAESVFIPVALIVLMLSAAVEAAESDKKLGTSYVDSPVAKACIAVGAPDGANPLNLGSYQGMAHAVVGPVKHNTRLGLGRADLSPLAKPNDVDVQVAEVINDIVERVQAAVRGRMDVTEAVRQGVKRMRQTTMKEYYRRVRQVREIVRDEMHRAPIRVRHAVEDWLNHQMHQHLHGHHQMIDI